MVELKVKDLVAKEKFRKSIEDQDKTKKEKDTVILKSDSKQEDKDDAQKFINQYHKEQAANQKKKNEYIKNITTLKKEIKDLCEESDSLNNTLKELLQEDEGNLSNEKVKAEQKRKEDATKAIEKDGELFKAKEETRELLIKQLSDLKEKYKGSKENYEGIVDDKPKGLKVKCTYVEEFYSLLNTFKGEEKKMMDPNDKRNKIQNRSVFTA